MQGGGGHQKGKQKQEVKNEAPLFIQSMMQSSWRAQVSECPYKCYHSCGKKSTSDSPGPGPTAVYREALSLCSSLLLLLLLY